MSNIEKANNEIFFFGLFKFAGDQMKKEAIYASKPFTNWGYLGRDIMINKWASQKVTTTGPKARLQLLEELIHTQKIIKVEDYLERLKFSVSVRQAQRDLKNHPQLKPVGFTRNKFYQVI